jgi:CRISPR-associated protein Csb1
MSQTNESKKPSELDVEKLLDPTGPACLIVTAKLSPVADLDRFQPAGFPEVGHVIYKGPRKDGPAEDVCIIDSPASMANHLETVCCQSATDPTLHEDLKGLPYVSCVTDRDDERRDRVVCTTLTEGHRIASDYFLDGLLDVVRKEESEQGQGKKKKKVEAHWDGELFRARLRKEFGLQEIEKDKRYFLYPDNWWTIYATIFRYDPNSLVHGVLFAKEQIKISRILTAHLEAIGAARVGRSGVKFDRLGKTTSGQPIFSVDEETAREIRVTFIIDLALLRSYGRGESGLSADQKRLLLDLAIWKIGRLLGQPFRYRTQCHLRCESESVSCSDGEQTATKLPTIEIGESIARCKFTNGVTPVYYPATKLFKFAEADPTQVMVPEDGGSEEEET